MMDKDDILDYGRLIDEAMHAIVKKAVEIAAEYGLHGEHHFYISFLTEYPGVMIADELKSKYEDEMTIVLQHQFWELEVEEDRFSVVLSFDNVQQNLTIPFAAITSFADPSVKFGLQFRHPAEEDEDDAQHKLLEDEIAEAKPQKPAAQKGGKKGGRKKSAKDEDGNVITLDNFRKK